MRAATDAVFRSRTFDPGSLQQTLWDRFWEWVGTWWHRIFGSLDRTPTLGVLTARVLLGLVLAVVVARVAYGIWLARELGTGERRRTGGAAAGARRDPWVEARGAAARGDYTAAAHALYRALLLVLAERERVRLHPAKTVGDYVRDLRQRSSALVGHFRDFARAYEVVVYGTGACDRVRYERLLGLADAILQGRRG